MGLEQLELGTGLNKVAFSINLLQTWEPREGYYFANSGGKDSAATRDLLTKAEVKFDGHYCVSPIDPKQVQDFLKQYHPDTQWDFHARGFWRLVDTKLALAANAVVTASLYLQQPNASNNFWSRLKSVEVISLLLYITVQ